MSRHSITHLRKLDKTWCAWTLRKCLQVLGYLREDIMTSRSKYSHKPSLTIGVIQPCGKCLSTQAFSIVDSHASVEREILTHLFTASSTPSPRPRAPLRLPRLRAKNCTDWDTSIQPPTVWISELILGSEKREATLYI